MSPDSAAALFPRIRQKSDINFGLSSHAETVVLLGVRKASDAQARAKTDMEGFGLAQPEAKTASREIKHT